MVGAGPHPRVPRADGGADVRAALRPFNNMSKLPIRHSTGGESYGSSSDGEVSRWGQTVPSLWAMPSAC